MVGRFSFGVGNRLAAHQLLGEVSMFKKVLAVGALAVLAIFTVPTAANAAPYGDGSGNAGTVVVAPGQAAALTFSGFAAGEPTTASAPDAVTLATVKVVTTANKAANASGAVTYTATATQPGTYTVTVTGASSSQIRTGTFTIAPADSATGTGSGSGSNANGSLPNTGLETPMLIVWGAGGALVLGIALVFVLTVVRRNKASA